MMPEKWVKPRRRQVADMQLHSSTALGRYSALFRDQSTNWAFVVLFFDGPGTTIVNPMQNKQQYK
jgi:hypothetical protein